MSWPTPQYASHSPIHLVAGTDLIRHLLKNLCEEATETGAGEGGGDDALDDYELCDVDDTCDHAIPWVTTPLTGAALVSADLCVCVLTSHLHRHEQEHRKQAVNENEESKSSTAAHKNRRPHKRKRRKAREPKRIFNGTLRLLLLLVVYADLC
jgi:hypothetical protein